MTNMVEYSVGKTNSRLLDEFRGDRIIGDVYIIKKNRLPVYEVTISTLGEWCNCQGFKRHSKCKHIQMAFDYREEFGL
jgi:hypothetical protein